MVFYPNDLRTLWENVMDVDLPKAQDIANAADRSDWKAGRNSAWWCFESKTQDTQSEPFCNNGNQGKYAWLFNHLINCKPSGCTDDSGATAIGYWTKDLVSNTVYAWRVNRNGNPSGYPVSNSTQNGVRPVITVLKSNLYQ